MKQLQYFLVLYFICSFISSTAQQDTLKYWIQFTDKTNTTFSIHQPLAYLSQRAIDRRQKSQIPITSQDFPINSWYIDSILSYSGTKLHNTSRWFNAITIVCDDTLSIQAIQNITFVVQVKTVQRLGVNLPNEKFTQLEPLTAEKTTLNYTTSFHYPYGLSYNQNHLHKIDYLHDLGFNGQGVHIGIIDSGFEYAHEMSCFKHVFEEGRLLSTRDFVDHDGDVFWDHYHGTAVFSTMAAYDPGTYYGTAIKASYHLLRSEEADSEHIVEEDNWIAAAEYADSAGVDIINTSLGYITFDDSLQNHTYQDLDGNTTRIAIAADIAASKGILLITSAGNSGDSDWKYISTPADADSTLTVGAVDSVGRYASFSSKGPASDGDIKPNIVSVGWNTYLYLPWGETMVRGNGTSFSAPMITGMAACLWQALPNLNNIELKKLIEESAHQYNSPDSLMGYGIPDIYKAYKSKTGLSYGIKGGVDLLSMYPNPLTSNTLNLIVSSASEQTITLMVSSIVGQKTQQLEVEIGVGKTLITVENLFGTAGTYLFSIVDKNGQKTTSKIIKLN